MSRVCLARRSGALLLIALCSLVLTGAAACDGDSDPELRQITFMAGFRPQASLPFAAVYVAEARGFFAEEGLAVDIRHAGQGEHLQLLLAKEIEFTTGTAAQVLRRRETGLPVRAVALFGQRGDQGFVVRADSGIEGPADFAGRSVGFKAGVVPAELKALLATAGLTEDDVQLQAVSFDPRVFIEGAVDVYPVFLSNEPDTIRRAGVDIRVFDPAEFGVPTLGLTFLAHADTVQTDPQLVERFLRAALRGAAYARDHLDEAIEVVLTFADGADAEHQRFLLTTDLANAERADGIGRAERARWEALERLLRDFGVLEAPVDVATAFDGSFVDRLYDAEGNLR